MNKTTRKKIDDMKTKLEAMQSDLEAIRDAEQDAFDSKSERWQEGEKGEAARAVIDGLNSACDSLTEVVGVLEDEVLAGED